MSPLCRRFLRFSATPVRHSLPLLAAWRLVYIQPRRGGRPAWLSNARIARGPYFGYSLRGSQVPKVMALSRDVSGPNLSAFHPSGTF